jgi:transcriptional regulator with XRE-family HTH domain
MKIIFKVLIMNRVDLKKFLRINNITQEKAAELLNVDRRTVNKWCNIEADDKNIGNKILILEKYISDLSVQNGNNNVQTANNIIGNNNIAAANVNGNGNTIQHTTHDVSNVNYLQQKIREKDERIREKDNLIQDLTKRYEKLQERLFELQDVLLSNLKSNK